MNPNMQNLFLFLRLTSVQQPQMNPDIQNLLPKLEVAIDSVITLEAAFQSLSGLSDILSILIDPLQGNS